MLEIEDSKHTRKTLVNPIAAQLSTTWSQEVPYRALNWLPVIPTSLRKGCYRVPAIPLERCPFGAGSPGVNPLTFQSS